MLPCYIEVHKSFRHWKKHFFCKVPFLSFSFTVNSHHHLIFINSLQFKKTFVVHSVSWPQASEKY